MGCCRRPGQVAVRRTYGAGDGLLLTPWPSRSASYLKRGRRAAAGKERFYTGPFEGSPILKPPALPRDIYSFYIAVQNCWFAAP